MGIRSPIGLGRGAVAALTALGIGVVWIAASASAPIGAWRESGGAISTTGPVGIGTDAPQTALAVRGTITAQEVIVTMDGWPDFVFEPDYPLLPLDDLAAYVRSHRRLPGLPPAEQVHATGLELGEMERLLAQQIEELVLYSISLRAENRSLGARVDALERRLREARP
jgi:hypothetical protein